MIAQPQRPEPRPPIGIIPAAAQLALDVVERSQTTSITMLQDVRTELRLAVDGGIELAEKTLAGMLRLARRLSQRLDEATGETLAGVDRVLGSSLRGARATSRAATDLASAAIDGLAGSRPASA